MLEGRFVGDRYHLVRELGRGGMGVVYLGRDLRLDMDVAIKFRSVMHGDATLWLKREFRAASSLRHPNLVELYELVAHETSCYFTMEYLPGIDPRRWVAILPERDLSDDLTTRSVPPLQEANTAVSGAAPVAVAGEIRVVPQVDFGRVRTIIAQLAEGLTFLHGSGVIHRDVKPSNAIVVGGVVKLLDFGLALERRRQDDDLAREGRIVGTMAYLAPEYVERLQVGPAMDVYALGVLAYELVTGTPPFGGTMHVLSRLSQRVRTPRAIEVNPHVPPELDVLIDRMLVADPELRPTAHEVASALGGSSPQPARGPRFVGRRDELADLAERIADPTPRGRLVLVTAPSGVGKSALIEAAVRDASAKALTWRGRCHERERVPYRAFDMIVDDLASELAGEPAIARAIDHPFALARVFPVLAHLIDPALDEPVAADLRVERERALLAMVQLVRHALRTSHGVIAIDDLQWSDEDSLELLEVLVARIERPLTVIASWTTDEPPRELRELRERLGKQCRLVDLPGLPEREVAELITDLAPHIPRVRIEHAAQLARGNAYMAEMIGRELADEDLSRPPDLLHAETRRLARLDDNERAVAELAALATGAMTFEQLKALSELPAVRLQSTLRGLEQARIVRATPAPTGDPVYVFCHQRFRVAAYDAMPDDVRRERHARLAQLYEKTQLADQLAFHWLHAGQPARAATWAVGAGDAAFSQLAWGVAADWYRKAIELGATAGEKLAESLFLAGKLDEAAEHFLALDGDRWRVRAAEAYLKLGEIDRGLRVLDDVLERRGQRRSRVRAWSVARAIAVGARWLAPVPVRPLPVDHVLASAYRVIASFLSTPYPIEALEYVVRGVALAERTRDDAAHGQGMAMLAAYLAAATLGRFGDRAIASAERLATRSGAAYPRMVIAGSAGILAMLRGEWSAMRGAHEDGERICRRLGLERSWEASFLRSYWALGEIYAGEPARALAMLGELTETSDDLFSRAMLDSYRGRALVVAGDLAAARQVSRALERSPRHGMADIYRRVFAGELALAEHDWDRAAAIAGELAGTAKEQWLSAMPAISAMIDVVDATAALGLAHRGDRDAARRARVVARGLFRRGNQSFYAVTALRISAQAEHLLGEQRAAQRTLSRAATLSTTRGGKVDRLAIAALAGAPIEAGALRTAITWSTGGVID